MKSPTLRRRRLAAEMRRIREALDLTRDEAARRLAWSASKVTRIEKAQTAAHHGDIADMLDVYEIIDERQRAALLKLAREGRQRGWWTPYRDFLTGFYVGLEAEAGTIRTYEPQYIPGLLQTEDYARAVTRASLIPDPDEVERRVTARMTRQQVLAQPEPPELWVVLDEAILRRPIGGTKVMREQLHHLVEAADSGYTTVQVLQFSVGEHPGMNGPFVLLDFPDPMDAPVVYLETATDGLYLEKTEELQRYKIMYDHLLAKALDPGHSIALIERVADELT